MAADKKTDKKTNKLPYDFMRFRYISLWMTERSCINQSEGNENKFCISSG